MRTSGSGHLGKPFTLGKKAPEETRGSHWRASAAAGPATPGPSRRGRWTQPLLPAARSQGAAGTALPSPAGRNPCRPISAPGPPAAALPAPARFRSRRAGGSRGQAVTRGSPLVLNFNPLVREPEYETRACPVSC